MSELIIKWLGHACFRFECRQHSAIIDPYREVPGYPKLECEAGEVYASHTQHDDHGYFEAVRLIAEPGNSPFKVSTVDTFHDSEGGTLRGRNRMTIFEADGVRFAHFGDLGHELSPEQLEAVKGLDVAMIPIGGYYTIDGVQAAKLAAECGAKIVIPMHFRRDGRGFDIIAEPSTFMDALSNEFVKHESDNSSILIEDRKAYLLSGNEEKVIDLDAEGQSAVLLRFNG